MIHLVKLTKKESRFQLIGVAVLAVFGLSCSGPSRRDSEQPPAVKSSQSISPNVQSEGSTSSASDVPSSPGANTDFDRSESDRSDALSKALRSGNGEAIESEAGRRLLRNPEDIIALNALAMWNYRQGRFGAARVLILRAIEKSQPSDALHANYGLILAAEGELLLAVDQWKKALRINDDNVTANSALGAVYLKGADFSRALPLLKRAHSENSKSLDLNLNYATALVGANEYSEADQVLRSSLKQFGNKDSRLLLNYAHLLIHHLDRPKDGLQLVYRIKLIETERRDILKLASELEAKALLGKNGKSSVKSAPKASD